MVRGVPCMCMATHPAPARRATSDNADEAEMSLTREAPAARAATATCGLTVSTESRTWPASASTTGTTRANSSSNDTGSAPGRDDSPPTSTMSAPSATICMPWATAASVVPWMPPSKKESGVTLSTPIMSGTPISAPG